MVQQKKKKRSIMGYLISQDVSTDNGSPHSNRLVSGLCAGVLVPASYANTCRVPQLPGVSVGTSMNPIWGRIPEGEGQDHGGGKEAMFSRWPLRRG